MEGVSEYKILIRFEMYAEKFIFCSITQAQPSEETENYQNNGISDDTVKLQDYQCGQSAYESHS